MMTMDKFTIAYKRLLKYQKDDTALGLLESAENAMGHVSYFFDFDAWLNKVNEYLDQVGDNEVIEEYYELTCPNPACRFLIEFEQLPDYNDFQCLNCGFRGELEDFE